MSRPRRRGIAAALLLLLFAIDALLVASGATDHGDRAILHALRRTDLPGVAISPEWTVALALWITAFGAAACRALVTLAGTALLLWQRRRRAAAWFFGAQLVELGLLPLLKLTFHRARPELPWRLAVEHDLSFPSGHALASMLLYPMLGQLLFERGGVGVGIAIAVAVGLTRIFLGVHWASDVLAGWAFGGAMALTALRFAEDGWPRGRRPR